MDGFIDFSFGSGDESVGKKSKRFKAEGGRSYRISFVWFDQYDDEGNAADGANPKFTGCERVYKQGVGYVLINASNRAAMIDLLKANPKQSVATVICVWPTDKDGELDAASFKAGKGYQIQPWVFSPDKYREIGRNHKRFPLDSHDLSMTCSDTQFQKMTFTPEGDNLLQKLLGAKSKELQAVGAKILEEARGIATGIHRDLARNMTVDDVRDALGEEFASPVGDHAAKNVDDLLDDVL